MSLDKRINNINKISKYFDVSQNFCKYYAENKILKQIDELKFKELGKGSRGKIYKIEDKKHNFSFAVKIMIVANYNLRKKMNLRQQRWREVYILQKFKEDILNKRIPNLPLILGYSICESKKFNSIQIYYEYFDNTLLNWILKEKEYDEWISMLLQIFITIKFYRDKYKLTHNDLTWVNVLYNNISKGGYWEYKTNNFNLYIPNLGYQFIIWDYGSSKSQIYEIIKEEKDYLEKFNTNCDVKYFIYIIKRIQMTHIINRYNLKELKELFRSESDNCYLKSSINDITIRCNKYNDFTRFNYILSKDLAFYLIEKDKYIELIKKNSKNIYNIEKEISIPPFKVIEKLNLIIKDDLHCDIDLIIKKYFSEYLVNKKYNIIETYNLDL